MLKNKEVPAQLVDGASDHYFNRGRESYILSVGSTVYKIFKTKSEDVLENKLKKIEILHQKNISFLTNPISTLSVNKKFVGYEMPIEKFSQTWKKCNLNREETVFYLKHLKEKLMILENNGIIYGDIKNDNFLINSKKSELKICDIDNVQIGDLKMDLLRTCLRTVNRDGDYSLNVPAFMHNIFSIEELDDPGLEFDYFMISKAYNSHIPIPNYPSFDETGNQVVKEMVKTKVDQSSFSGRYIIEHLQ